MIEPVSPACAIPVRLNSLLCQLRRKIKGADDTIRQALLRHDQEKTAGCFIVVNPPLHFKRAAVYPFALLSRSEAGFFH